MLNAISPKSRPMAAVETYFKGADLAFANLEIPLTRSTSRTPFKTVEEIKKRDQFVLKADPGHIDGLKSAGIDAVSLANNHAMDYGAAGLREMTSLLDKAKISHSGAGTNWQRAKAPTVVVAPDGTRVGLVSALAFIGRGALRKCGPAATNRAGIAVLPFDGQINAKARKQLRIWFDSMDADVKVVALHWGLEKKTLPTTYQKQLAKACIEEGADIVWGHHPHVLQPVEMYRGKPIMYSTGNLISPTPAVSAVYRVTIEGDKYKIESTPIRIRGGKIQPLPRTN